MPPPVSLAILAGGPASRMGGIVKGLLTLEGETLIERIARRLAVVCSEQFLVVRDETPFSQLDLSCYRDGFWDDSHSHQQGLPLALLTALHAASEELVLLCGADMPFVSASMVELLLEAHKPGLAVVTPSPAPGLVEPLFSLYHRASCREPLEAMVADGEKRMNAFFEKVETRILPVTHPRAFTNINERQDIERLGAAFD